MGIAKERAMFLYKLLVVFLELILYEEKLLLCFNVHFVGQSTERQVCKVKEVTFLVDE